MSFSASGSVRAVVFQCDETILGPPAFLSHLSEITDKHGHIWMSVEGPLGLLLLGKTFCKQLSPELLYVAHYAAIFFLHHSEIWSRKQMHGDARTTSDSERLTQLLHTRVLEMIIYFLWADATGKPANSNLCSNSVKQCTEFLEGLSAKPAAPVPY